MNNSIHKAEKKNASEAQQTLSVQIATDFMLRIDALAANLTVKYKRRVSRSDVVRILLEDGVRSPNQAAFRKALS